MDEKWHVTFWLTLSFLCHLVTLSRYPFPPPKYYSNGPLKIHKLVKINWKQINSTKSKFLDSFSVESAHSNCWCKVTWRTLKAWQKKCVDKFRTLPAKLTVNIQSKKKLILNRPTSSFVYAKMKFLLPCSTRRIAR